MTLMQEEKRLRNYLFLQKSGNYRFSEMEQQDFDALMCRFRHRYGKNADEKLRELTDLTFTVPDFVKGGKTK